MPRLTGFRSVPIPGPRGLPFAGVHLNLMRLVLDPINRLPEMRRAHGDVVAVASGSPAVVCVFGADRNREVLSNPTVFENDDEALIPVPEGTSLRTLMRIMPHLQGEEARRHRRLVTPAFQRSALNGYASAIVEVTERALSEWPVGQTADIALLTRELVQRVAIRCLFGLTEDNDAHGLAHLVEAFIDGVANPLSVALPFRIRGLPYARVHRLADELVVAFRALFEEKRRGPPANDVLALILRARDEDGTALSDEDLIGEAAVLYFAGYDTQAKTLAWTLFLLEQHPRVLADLVDENEAVLRGGPPIPAHIPNMPLLDRVIKESMRILTAVPVLFLRVCQSEATVGGHLLPKGANVIVSPFVTHHDPSLYPDSKRFLPARWETIQPSPYAYLPFGAGARYCIGAPFASQSLRLMLAMILQRYRLSLAWNARVSVVAQSNLLGLAHGLPMLIAPQDRRFRRQDKLRGNIASLVDLGAAP